MKTLRPALLTLALAALPAIAQTPPPQEPLRIGDMLTLLIAAYNGAADAAEQGGRPLFHERLSPEETARLQRGLNYLQGELQNLVKADGSLDSKRTAELLNALQQLKGGEMHFDFVKAEAALDHARKQEDGALLDGILNVLTGASGAALSADVAQYRRIAAEQLGTATHPDTLTDLLKLVYADRQLGTINENREAQAHALIAQIMQQGGISQNQFEDIRRLLDAISGPFKADARAWKGAQNTLLRPTIGAQEINGIIDALQNKQLTPEQREQILRALQH